MKTKFVPKCFIYIYVCAFLGLYGFLRKVCTIKTKYADSRITKARQEIETFFVLIILMFMLSVNYIRFAP